MLDPAPDPLAWLIELEGVPSAFAAARDGIDALLRDRGLRRTSPEQTTESLLRGAHASAVLEGSGSTLEEVRAGSGDDVAQAAVRVSTGVLALVPVIGTSPAQAFARLHALAGKGEVEDDRLGRPVSPEAAARLNALTTTLLATSVPALVVGALVHAELLTVAPFVSHNGVVARAAERLVMVARGVDPASVVVPESGHLAVRAAYESNLRGYRDGGRAGLHSWLLYAAEAVTAGVEASPLRDG
ncbi:MAG TPA: oxidoreductase [Marmoricola sp.]